MAGARFHDKINMQTGAFAAAARVLLDGNRMLASGVGNGLGALGQGVARSKERGRQDEIRKEENARSDARFAAQQDLTERKFAHQKEQAGLTNDLRERSFEHGQNMDFAQLGQRREEFDFRREKHDEETARAAEIGMLNEAELQGLTNSVPGLLSQATSSDPEALRSQASTLAALSRQILSQRGNSESSARMSRNMAVTLASEAQRMNLRAEQGDRVRVAEQRSQSRRMEIDGTMVKAIEMAQEHDISQDELEGFRRILESNPFVGVSGSNKGNQLFQQWFGDTMKRKNAQKAARARADAAMTKAAEANRDMQKKFKDEKEGADEKQQKKMETTANRVKDQLNRAWDDIPTGREAEISGAPTGPDLEAHSIEELQLAVNKFSGSRRRYIEDYIQETVGIEEWRKAFVEPASEEEAKDIEIDNKIQRLNETRLASGKDPLTSAQIEELRKALKQRGS